jgi:hypothetical protein
MPFGSNPLSARIADLKSKKKLKPTMRIQVSHPSPFGDDYDKQEMDDLSDQIDALQKHKDTLTPEKAHKHMTKALDAEIMQKKGRHMELKGRLGR